MTKNDECLAFFSTKSVVEGVQQCTFLFSWSGVECQPKACISLLQSPRKLSYCLTKQCSQEIWRGLPANTCSLRFRGPLFCRPAVALAPCGILSGHAVAILSFQFYPWNEAIQRGYSTRSVAFKVLLIPTFFCWASLGNTEAGGFSGTRGRGSVRIQYTPQLKNFVVKKFRRT